jgi:hypothetical protein
MNPWITGIIAGFNIANADQSKEAYQFLKCNLGRFSAIDPGHPHRLSGLAQRVQALGGEKSVPLNVAICSLFAQSFS